MPTSPRNLFLPAALAAALLGGALACGSLDPGREAGSRRTAVWVYAEDGWTDTGFEVEPGDDVVIKVLSGEWSPWPEESFDALGSGGDPRCDCNILAGVSHAALIGRIGDGRPFLVGAEYHHAVGEAGRLYLGINDTRLEDNSGRLRVRVRVD
jgi:hypothetical protein